jgi:hypothetical protein
LLKIQKEADQTSVIPLSLTAFLNRRGLLLNAYENVRLIHDDSLEDKDDFSSRNASTNPEGWSTESWRSEASLWANIEARVNAKQSLVESQRSIISLFDFLSVLEVKQSKPSLDTLKDLSSFLFKPLLQDVFVLSTIAKAMKDIGPSLPSMLKDKSTCLNPAASFVDCSSYLFAGDGIRTWGPSALYLLSNWLNSLSAISLNQCILSKSASSNGVLRFMESLCIHSLEVKESASSEAAHRFPPSWSAAFESCSTATRSHAVAFAVATILQEAHTRTTKLVESKTYGMKTSPVSPQWSQLLCALRCCLLVDSRRCAVEILYSQLVASGAISRSPSTLFELPLLSSKTFQIERSADETIMNIIVQDRCALDLLHCCQVTWARSKNIALPQPLQGTTSTFDKKSVEEGGSWPDPKQPNLSNAHLWSSISFDQLLSSELSTMLSKKGLSASSEKGELYRTSGDKLTALSLPPGWVPLAEWFVYCPHSPNKPAEEGAPSSFKLSRFCFHCHCSLRLAKIMAATDLEHEERLRIQSLELAVAHVLVVSRNQLPVVKRTSVIFESGTDRMTEGKIVVEVKVKPEKKWYDFFDYDMPADGYAGNNMDDREHDECAHVVAAALASRIFEDILFPKVQYCFFLCVL